MTLTRFPSPRRLMLAAVPLTLLALLAGGRAGKPAGAAVPDAPGRLTATASMSAERAAHTATTLPDGRVLVAGGFTTARSPRAAQIYDPATALFRPLPPMIASRHSHTATLLRNGQVLIAGGYAAGGEPVATVELFDPATNGFVPTGSMNAARADHIAVMLDDGTVLLAGGLGPSWTFLSSAEIYDPSTGRSAPTGDLTVARESHVAVKLKDGRVLVVGGHRDRRAAITLYSSAEVYDVSTGRFTRTGDMQVRRHKHDAVLLPDGHVLVTGGSDERDNRGVYDSTELFDPATGRFARGPVMQRPRYKHHGSAVLLPNGRVLLGGGASEAEIYDPARRTFTLVPGDARMAGQFSAVAALRSGGVLITGGYGSGTGPRASAWVYTP